MSRSHTPSSSVFRRSNEWGSEGSALMLVMHSNNLFAMLWFTGRVAYWFNPAMRSSCSVWVGTSDRITPMTQKRSGSKSASARL